MIGYSLLWSRYYFLISKLTTDWLNALSHTWHLYGFSPEWLRMCTASSLQFPHGLPHSGHLNLPLWIFIWLRRPFWYAKRLSHWVHEYSSSAVCVPLWSLNCPLCVSQMSSRGHSVTSSLSVSVFISICWELPLSSDSVSTALQFPVDTQHHRLLLQYRLLWKPNAKVVKIVKCTPSSENDSDDTCNTPDDALKCPLLLCQTEVFWSGNSSTTGSS